MDRFRIRADAGVAVAHVGAGGREERSCEGNGLLLHVRFGNRIQLNAGNRDRTVEIMF